jgi:hypothetical protein
MKFGRGEIEPMHVLAEFKCEAIPGVAAMATITKKNPKRRKNTPKAARASSKRKSVSSAKPKSHPKKRPSA